MPRALLCVVPVLRLTLLSSVMGALWQTVHHHATVQPAVFSRGSVQGDYCGLHSDGDGAGGPTAWRGDST